MFDSIANFANSYNIIKSLEGAIGTVYEIEADDNKRYELKRTQQLAIPKDSNHLM